MMKDLQPKHPNQDTVTHSQFLTFVVTELEKNRESNAKSSLLVIDPDNFTAINESHGYEAGDVVLRRIGEIIQKSLRDFDISTRFEGAMFASYLPGADVTRAGSAAERIRHAVKQANIHGMTVSIGIASFPEDGSDVRELVSNAREALYQAKMQGKNRANSHTVISVATERNLPRILIVDDDAKNRKLLKAIIEPHGYETTLLSSAEEMFDFLKVANADLILLDVMMTGMDGFAACRRIKSRKSTRRIPVVLVTALDDVQSRVKGIEAGADDFLTKPPERHELIARIHSLAKTRELDRNLTDLENVLLSLAGAVEAKDSYTNGHTERVAALASEIGRRLDLPEGDIQALRLGGILHDIGKIGVSQTTLNKTGPLDDNDWEVIRAHPDIGYRICLPLAHSIGKALDIIRHHHEKLDGSSYPDGLAGNDISLVARIMAVADIYDALTTDRPYRKAMTAEKALAILDEDVSSGKLDAAVVTEMHALVRSESKLGRRTDDDSTLDRKRILVIEDDELNMKLVKALLHESDYQIFCESSADDGIEVAKREKPDLILMDIQLPRIDGINATRILKSEPGVHDIPIIAMSAHAMEQDIRNTLDSGCVDYITKPIDTRNFVSRIEEYLA
jgi:putative two-component system response regulator